jgi:hypothetical protein
MPAIQPEQSQSHSAKAIEVALQRIADATQKQVQCFYLHDGLKHTAQACYVADDVGPWTIAVEAVEL